MKTLWALFVLALMITGMVLIIMNGDNKLTIGMLLVVATDIEATNIAIKRIESKIK